MALKKSPRGLIKPYTREGVTSLLKKTAKDTSLLKSATKSLEQISKGLRSNHQNLSDEEAEDAMVDVQLLAMQVRASAKVAVKELEQALAKAGKYLAETSE